MRSQTKEGAKIRIRISVAPLFGHPMFGYRSATPINNIGIYNMIASYKDHVIFFASKLLLNQMGVVTEV